ncbi:helix-turn-helix domain-containing protein [Streptomyces sp. NPDC058525]|uniref:helix-turn-helix domain-containing protein n=1 Tax=Streptomyces sp. NPDC058525 TaxID=3346538 RepID=UPI003651893C
MEALSFDQWALGWAAGARAVPHGAVVAGLLVDLAADPRAVYAVPTVAFPLNPAARALGVSPVIVRTAMHQLADAGLVRLHAEDRPDGSWMTVTLLPPVDSSSVQGHAPASLTQHDDMDDTPA